MKEVNGGREMTEERINSAAETIHSANRLSITKGILSTVAAEVREEGIEDFADALAEKFGPYSVILELAERVKEKGK